MTSPDPIQGFPVRLHAPPTWTFYHVRNVVLGRPASKIGTLQITLAYTMAAGDKADHDACLGVLRQFMDEPHDAVQSERSDQADAIFGRVTLNDGKTLRRYWYRHKNDRLLLALYQCDAQDFTARAAEVDEAGAIAASMELEYDAEEAGAWKAV